jgi:hypothetical protein
MRTARYLVPLLFLASCGDPPNRLYGSVSQVFSLDFDQTQIIRAADDEVSVEYLRMSGQTVLAKVVKVTVSIGDIQPVAGMDVDMTAPLANGLPRGVVQRVESTTTDFTLQVGKIHFDQEPVADANVTGWFHTTLLDPAAGRTLNGDFQDKVQAQ